MKRIVILILASIILISCRSTENSGNQNTSVVNYPNHQYDGKLFSIDFISDPLIDTAFLPIEGQQIEMITYTDNQDSSFYLLMQFDLHSIRKTIEDDPRSFFQGMVSFLMDDIGVESTPLEEYNLGKYPGSQFKAIPRKDSVTAIGRTLLVENYGFLLFALSSGMNSGGRALKFLDSFSPK